ncbi:MAG: tetratricopeptide repeat protein [Gemmataceae bacterium]
MGRGSKPMTGEHVGWAKRAQPAPAHPRAKTVDRRGLRPLCPPYGIWSTLLAICTLLLISAAPPTADDWERRGNEAFADARFDEAAKCYAAAEDASGEPGRVAFNHGVALFNLGRYRDAERLFRCALESESAADRRARSLFNLGTSLLHASDRRDARRLVEAGDCFSRCLKIPSLDESLAADARHNLELSKLLWRRIRSSESPPPESDPTANNDETNPGTKPPETGNTNDGSSDRRGQGGPGNDRTATVPTQADGPKPVPTNDAPPPGAGRHAPISEDDQMKPLPPQEARELVREAVDRVQRERRALQRAGAGSDVRPYPDY